MRNFKAESFIQQFLSPKVIRDLKLFCALDDDNRTNIEIMAIHNDECYRVIREQLAGQYNLDMPAGRAADQESRRAGLSSSFCRWRQNDSTGSFTDAAIVALARKRGARWIATFDQDFAGIDEISTIPAF